MFWLYKIYVFKYHPASSIFSCVYIAQFLISVHSFLSEYEFLVQVDYSLWEIFDLQ